MKNIPISLIKQNPNAFAFMASKIEKVMCYSIGREFPFDIIYHDSRDLQEGYMSSNYLTFATRLEAETAKLEELYYYYKLRGFDSEREETFEQLKNIEEEHPEWTI